MAKAWTRFGELAEQVATLASVLAGLSELTAGPDVSGDFLNYRDDPRARSLWGAGYGVRRNTQSRPWPTDPRGHLAWMLASGRDLWVPTGVQRAARWVEVFGDPHSARLAGDTVPEMT